MTSEGFSRRGPWEVAGPKAGQPRRGCGEPGPGRAPRRGNGRELMLRPPGALVGLAGGTKAPPRFTPEALWKVMERQVALYTGTDSSSVTEETARELLESISFCVRVALENMPDGVAAPGLADALLWGQRILTGRHAQGLRLLREAKRQCLPIQNEVYREVLGEAEAFYTWYDIRFFAHQIPCMIDYPLAIAVDESLLGVDFMNLYVQRRLWEDRFCGLFPMPRLAAVLAGHAPGYLELPLNLFSPVFNCALGKVLLGTNPRGLLFREEETGALAKLLAGWGAEETEKAFRAAGARLCNELYIWDTARREYLLACALAAMPHMRAAGGQGLLHIFIPGE